MTHDSTSSDEQDRPPTDPEPQHADDDPMLSPSEVRRRWRVRPIAAVLARIAVALFGVFLGILAGGHTTADIGPIRVSADLLIGPASTTLRIPPLGSLEVDAYEGPVQLQMTVLTVDRDKAEQYVNGSKTIDELTTQIESDLQSALSTLLVKTVLWAVVGGGLMSLLVFRRPREAIISIGTALGLIVATGVIGYATFDAKAFQAPKYTGLLEQAPAIVGNVSNLAEKFADYRKSLVKLVTNVSSLYSAVSTLPSDASIANTTKVLFVSDIHMNPAGFDLVASLVEQYKVDFVIDTGDLVDWGTPQESATFSTIGRLGVPYVYIRGNHDSMTTQAQMAAIPNVKVLDQSEITVSGITIVGVGDPRFSPDRTTYDDSTLQDAADNAARKYATWIESLPKQPDVVLFHDPTPADELADSGPLILSGHTHKRDVQEIDDDTLLLVQGSTGGAGLRGLEGEAPTPLEASVLYFDSISHKLQAWDDITLGGLGETDVSITRKLAPKAVEEAEQSAAEITASEEAASESAAAESEASASAASESASGDSSATDPNNNGDSAPAQPQTTESPPAETSGGN